MSAKVDIERVRASVAASVVVNNLLSSFPSPFVTGSSMLAPLDLVSAKLSKVTLFQSVISLIALSPSMPNMQLSQINEQSVYDVLLNLPRMA